MCRTFSKGGHQESIQARNALPPSGDRNSPMEIHCPHCANPVIVTKKVSGGFVLHKTENLDKKEVRARGLAIASADGKVANAQDRLWEAQRLLTEGKRQTREAAKAQDQLKKIESRKKNVSTEQVEACRRQVQRAETHLAVFKTKRQADRLHASVKANQQVIKVLAPDGLRAWKLVEAVRTLNDEVLAPLSQSAGWQTISLNDDLMPAMGGRLVSSPL